MFSLRAMPHRFFHHIRHNFFPLESCCEGAEFSPPTFSLEVPRELVACNFLATSGDSTRRASSLLTRCEKAMQRMDLSLSGVVQVDGCVIGGHRIAENTRDEFGRRRYRRKYENRRVVVVAREPFGKTKVFVGKKEADSSPAISRTVSRESLIHARRSKSMESPFSFI